MPERDPSCSDSLNGAQTRNGTYDVVAEAEAILADAALATV
jgi:hypothetical protein